MKRLVFLLPDTQLATTVVDELTATGIHRDDIHVVARHGIAVEALPDGSHPDDTSDYFPALEKGTAIGGVTGLLAGLVAIAFPGPGVVIGGGAVLLTTLFGATLGALSASMIGTSVPDSHLKRYQQAIEDGEILMLADVPADRVDEISELIRSHHPQAEVRGVDPPLPPL